MCENKYNLISLLETGNYELSDAILCCVAQVFANYFYVHSHIAKLFLNDAMHKFYNCDLCYRSVDLALY